MSCRTKSEVALLAVEKVTSASVIFNVSSCFHDEQCTGSVRECVLIERTRIVKSLINSQLFEEVFARYTQNEVFLSFNGGKDCTVLLDMLMRWFREVKSENCNIRQHYSIDIHIMKGTVKSILHKICKENPTIKACFMGSRKTDPHCENLQPMQETDSDWPKIVRINPLLEWTCAEVWEYIKRNHVPYCSLYDLGYTSIGDKTNTVPNPYLRYTSSSGDIMFLPAYQLHDADKYERAGRI
ncbi:probable FAD synthase isoform X3 [Wyeomyia smithii]|uniref:probable FAD synthase isoform X3 n=1 Tax=Wyeomyia smithii TaxID=174621 RepID=UPI002468008A|nr:probable FAD synthase isoform X3 [Wyeomyia smithii]